MMSIDQLLLVSFNLTERVTGRPLDETASLEEIKESIFYVSKHHDSHQDVVTLWGLASALYNTFADDGEQMVVQFSNETMVFVALEDKTIIAIARVATSSSSKLTPATIQQSIERSHELFCLLRGGGIRRRLDSDEDLAHLFELHKIARNMNSSDLQALNQYRSQLAITHLRKDLAVHYDTFLSEPLACEDEFNLTSPIRFLPENPSSRIMSIDETERVDELLAQMLDSTCSLIGAFVIGDDGEISSSSSRDPELSKLLRTNSRISILHDYLLQIRQSCLISHHSSVGSNYFVVPSTPTATDTTTSATRTGFLSPPPMSQLSSLDTAVDKVEIGPVDQSQEGDSSVTAWAPRIFLDGPTSHRVLLYNTKLILVVAIDCSYIQDPTFLSYLEKIAQATESRSYRRAVSLPLDSDVAVDCTFLPEKNVWIYQTKDEAIVLDATVYKDIADVQSAVEHGTDDN